MHDITLRMDAVFRDVFWGEELPVRSITRLNTARWDSLAHLNLILSIEQEFQITLSDDEIIEMNSYEVALDIVKSRLARVA